MDFHSFKSLLSPLEERGKNESFLSSLCDFVLSSEWTTVIRTGDDREAIGLVSFVPVGNGGETAENGGKTDEKRGKTDERPPGEVLARWPRAWKSVGKRFADRLPQVDHVLVNERIINTPVELVPKLHELAVAELPSAAKTLLVITRVAEEEAVGKQAISDSTIDIEKVDFLRDEDKLMAQRAGAKEDMAWERVPVSASLDQDGPQLQGHKFWRVAFILPVSEYRKIVKELPERLFDTLMAKVE